MWTEVYELAQLLKEKKSTFEELDLDDVDIRLKVNRKIEFFLCGFSLPFLRERLGGGE
jgi:hypothetical protein